MVTSSCEAAGKSDGEPDPQPRQIAVYRQYLKLQSIAGERYSGSLAGRMVLSVGFGLQGAELALATTIAGGTFLGIEPDPQKLKAAVRNSSCDFMVNTLDEALRVLKNELRKRSPLSVGLLGDASGILTEVVERGVQPDLIAAPSPNESATSAKNPTSQKRDVGHPGYRHALDQLMERGAGMLDLTFEGENSPFEEVTWTTANPQDLRRLDKIGLELIPLEDQVRRRWLEGAAGSFYRQTPLTRVVGFRPEEMTHLIDSFRNASSSSAFQSPAVVRWRGLDGTEQTVTL
jgi:urocanate hydratase